MYRIGHDGESYNIQHKHDNGWIIVERGLTAEEANHARFVYEIAEQNNEK